MEEETGEIRNGMCSGHRHCRLKRGFGFTYGFTGPSERCRKRYWFTGRHGGGRFFYHGEGKGNGDANCSPDGKAGASIAFRVSCSKRRERTRVPAGKRGLVKKRPPAISSVTERRGATFIFRSIRRKGGSARKLPFSGCKHTPSNHRFHPCIVERG